MRKLHMPYLQITNAALNLYAAEGPRGVTMRRVARSVGVTASALYRHFLNKEALLDAVAGQAELWLGKALEKPKRQRARTNRVAAVAERALRFAVDHPHVFQLVSRRKPKWHRPPPTSASEVVRYEVSQGISQRQLRPAPAAWVARAVWAQLCGLAALHERGDLDRNAAVLRDQWVGAADRLLYGLVRS